MTQGPPSRQQPAARERLLWAPRAWLQGRWQDGVLLAIDGSGHWQSVTADQPCPPQARRLDGPVLPPLVDAHSHAFQRAFVGMAERRHGAHDDFWSWRDRMYGVALRITPGQLRAVAAHLYAELLQGGYTQVCEFHYLHHAPDGSAYDDAATMAQALADAAHDAGIGLTLLPVLYERAGFAADGLRPDQRRFAAGVQQVLALRQAAQGFGMPLVNAGVAVHSLRAARPASMVALAERCSGPVHVHVAEQTGEVDDCLAATGLRPIAWLAQPDVCGLRLDARWQLVHATHATPAEIEAVAATGAGVVLCPGTEANLGDGVPDLPRWLAAGVPLAVGSDSQVTRSWPEELRWLEYGQRLLLRRRNVSAAPGSGPGSQPATAARLVDRMLQGGGAAAGLARWGLQTGARADLLVLDTADAALHGLPASHVLDGVVFAAPQRPFSGVLVAGHWRALQRPDLAARHAAAMQALWADAGPDVLPHPDEGAGP